MSYVEGPKSRFATLVPAIAPPANRSFHLKPGCVQCGNLLERSDNRNANFSGKCFSCENWVSDEDEEFDDFED